MAQPRKILYAHKDKPFRPDSLPTGFQGLLSLLQRAGVSKLRAEMLGTYPTRVIKFQIARRQYALFGLDSAGLTPKLALWDQTGGLWILESAGLEEFPAWLKAQTQGAKK